jgi:hypothetical protein
MYGENIAASIPMGLCIGVAICVTLEKSEKTNNKPKII